MARSKFTFRTRTVGRHHWRKFGESLVIALAHAGREVEDDLFDITPNADVLFNGVIIVRLERETTAGMIILRMIPTANMILFAGWILNMLPSTARVTWHRGWPRFHCPPNEDRDRVDDPTPLAPEELHPS